MAGAGSTIPTTWSGSSSKLRSRVKPQPNAHLRVIPVLVEGANMPGPTDLPPSLAPLCYRIAVPVRRDPDFKSDNVRLITALRSDWTTPRLTN